MKGLEAGKDRVKKICDTLRKETLEPAKAEALEMREAAEKEAAEILAKAKREADKLLEESRKTVEKQKAQLQVALTQACHQVVGSLREEIQEKLFRPELTLELKRGLQEVGVIEKLIAATIKALDKEGSLAEIEAYIPAEISAKEIAAALTESVRGRLKEGSIFLKDIGGGVEIKLKGEQITLDLSLQAVQEMVSGYMRKELIPFVFGS